MSAWKRAGLLVGAVGAAVGAGVAAERLVAARLRKAEDPDGAEDLVAEFDASWRIPSHDGGELYVVERGQGPVIVLSHGVVLSVQTWAKQLRSLADAGFRVVAFDHRGHGASTVGHAGHTVDNLGADLRSVIEALDLEDVVIVGHSMGGVAVLSFCSQFPDDARERVAGIVLLSSLARSILSGKTRIANVSTWVAERLPDGASALRARDLGLVLTRLGFGRDPEPRHIEATRQMILGTAPTTRREAVSALAGLDLTSRLGDIDRPTLVICGTADLITPLAESRRMARRIPGSRLEVIEGGGHMLMFERSALLHDFIVDFAQSVQLSVSEISEPRDQTTGY